MEKTTNSQPSEKEKEKTRNKLEKLLKESKLYETTDSYKELLEFVKKFRGFAPFNAFLLHIQRPGITFAATAREWKHRFGRRIKPHARPLIILWPMGPVALVYDVQDTEGPPLPKDAEFYQARGPITEKRISAFVERLAKRRIDCEFTDWGYAYAGCISIKKPATQKKKAIYVMNLNKNHDPPTQFATMAHELAHLCLGHLGKDKEMHIPDRSELTNEMMELEAESVSYLVCSRNEVETPSQIYLSNYVNSKTQTEDLNIYEIMRAAGKVEYLLGVSEPEPPPTPKVLTQLLLFGGEEVVTIINS